MVMCYAHYTMCLTCWNLSQAAKLLLAASRHASNKSNVKFKYLQQESGDRRLSLVKRRAGGFSCPLVLPEDGDLQMVGRGRRSVLKLQSGRRTCTLLPLGLVSSAGFVFFFLREEKARLSSPGDLDPPPSFSSSSILAPLVAVKLVIEPPSVSLLG